MRKIMVIDLDYTDEQIVEVIRDQNINLNMKEGQFGINIPSCKFGEDVANAILFINYSPLYLSVSPLFNFVPGASKRAVSDLCARIETIANQFIKENYKQLL